MVNVGDRRCVCTKKLPTYGMPEDSRPNYCSDCKTEGMINLKDKNKRCECGKVIPSFGMKGDKKASCCVACKKPGMINLLLDLCPCGKSAAFGMKGDKKPSYCMTCATEGMENIVTKKCKCGKAVPSFGLETDKRATCCMACKSEEMINIIASKCKCGSAQATFGEPLDKRPTCCIKCKTEGMIDIRSRRCKCGKAQPTFGLVTDKKPICCIDCKTPDMKNVRSKMCKCGKVTPIFGFETDARATCCASCKEVGMRDIVTSKCPTHYCKGTFELQEKGLKCPYEHRGKKKYDYYCTRCFEQNFPDDPRTAKIRDKTEENKVRAFLATTFPAPSFIHNKALWTDEADCTCRRRIDFRTLIGNTLLCIEVDENQHKYRDEEDEEIRYDDLMLLHGGKFVFIRYNPDSYVDEEGTTVNPSEEERFKVLEDTIHQEIKRIYAGKNEDLVEIIRLFYDLD